MQKCSLSWCRRPRCWQGWFLLKALRENVFQASLPASGGSRPSSVFLGLELHHPLSASIFPWPPSLCLSVTDPLIRTPVIGFRAHPKSSMVSSRDPKLVTSAKTHFQIRSHSEVSSVYYFGGAIQPSMVGDVCEIAAVKCSTEMRCGWGDRIVPGGAGL